MKSMFSLAFVLPHHMNTGLMPARMEHLLLRVVLIPTLAMEMVCCSMASDLLIPSSATKSKMAAFSIRKQKKEDDRQNMKNAGAAVAHIRSHK